MKFKFEFDKIKKAETMATLRKEIDALHKRLAETNDRKDMPLNMVREEIAKIQEILVDKQEKLNTLTDVSIITTIGIGLVCLVVGVGLAIGS